MSCPFLRLTLSLKKCNISWCWHESTVKTFYDNSYSDFKQIKNSQIENMSMTLPPESHQPDLVALIGSKEWTESKLNMKFGRLTTKGTECEPPWSLDCTIKRSDGHGEHTSLGKHIHISNHFSQSLKWSKVLSLILYSLLGCVCSGESSHVFSFVNLKGAGNSTLLKWIVMYAWQTPIMRLARGCVKEEMLEIREELIRSHFYD